jgi:predicted phosphodiesterase
MRIAIISDIHEDFFMLERALMVLRSQGYDMLVCLGDITGFAPEFYSHKPDANSCIDLLRDNAHIVLAGNHDLYSAKRLPSYHLEKNIPANWYELNLEERYKISNNTIWLYEEEIVSVLSQQNKDYINMLVEYEVYDDGRRKLLFSHFLQPDLSGISRWFPYRVGELKPHFKFMEERNTSIAFVGHAHPEGVTLLSKLFWSAPVLGNIRAGDKPKIVLCPAVVRNQKPSGCLIYDTHSREILSLPLYP